MAAWNRQTSVPSFGVTRAVVPRLWMDCLTSLWKGLYDVSQTTRARQFHEPMRTTGGKKRFSVLVTIPGGIYRAVLDTNHILGVARGSENDMENK